MEASSEGGQGPEGAVAPYMEWNNFTLINLHGVLRDSFALTYNLALLLTDWDTMHFLVTYDQQPNIWTR